MSSNDQNRKPWETVSPSGRMLRPSAVFEITGLSKSQTYDMIQKGDFPPFIKLSERASAMPEAWLNAFIASRVEIAISPSAAPNIGSRKDG